MLIAIEVDEELHGEIKKASEKEDRSMASFVRLAIRESLERRSPQPLPCECPKKE